VHVTVLAHNVEPHERIPGALLAARAALAPADRIVVHGSASARAARRLLPRAEVVAHPHPPYLSLFPSPACGRGEARARLGIDPAARVVLHFGCVKPYKGLHDLIEAMPGVVREAPDARLIVAGEFYDPVERYAEKARSLGVDAAVRLLDRYVPNAEVGLHLRAADVVALPYREATGSGVLPLALAAGVPIVATSVGDIPDAMVDGRDGALVPPRDPPALAAAILSILSGRSPRPHTPGSAASWDSLARVCLGNG
jgi:glycosyltransferase involved in cell wall biosynthesis